MIDVDPVFVQNGGSSRAWHPTADHAPRLARAGAEPQIAAGGPQGRVPGLPLGALERQGVTHLNAADARALGPWRRRGGSASAGNVSL